MADGPSDGDKAVSRLAEIEGKLKAEGFSTVEELISAYQTASAERDKAVAARDKFNENNDAAQEIIRSKAGEIGTLKQEVEQLKQENEELKKGGGGTPAAPTPPAKSVDEELTEVEASLTPEHKKLADQYLEKMDDEDAARVAGDKKTRLAFLKGLRDDPANKTLSRPKSLWDTEPKQTPQNEDDVYENLKKKIGVSPAGPASPSRRGVQPSKEPAKEQPGWLN